MRKLPRPILVVVVGLCLFGGCYLQRGGWMMNNPKYSESRLLGLTTAEVVERLGKPDYDPRSPTRFSTKIDWTSEAESGPLNLGYHQGWATCVIQFKNGRAVSVERFYK